MTNRIVATFSSHDVRAMGARFNGLREAMTPLLSALAGEVVFWASLDDGGWHVLAGSQIEYVSKDSDWRPAPRSLVDYRETGFGAETARRGGMVIGDAPEGRYWVIFPDMADACQYPLDVLYPSREPPREGKLRVVYD